MEHEALAEPEGRSARGPAARRETAGAVYVFGDHELDAERFELRRRGARVPIQPKPLALLLYLARHHTRLVPREELVTHLWPDVSVSDDALFHAVKMAREAVGDRGSRQGVIETVRGVGFRFAAPLELRGGVPARGPAPRAPARSAPLVGREALLARLEAALDDAAAGRGGIVLLEGEAGVGKTSLLDAVADLARARGLRVARGACRESGGPAFAPWSQALEELLAAASDSELSSLSDAATGPWIAALVPILVERLPGLAPGARDERGESRWRQFAAVSRALALAARAHPLVVLLDDLHWADTASLRLVEHLVPELRRQPLLVVGAQRDERTGGVALLSVLRGEIARTGAGCVERVERLSRDEVGRLFAALSGAAPEAWLVSALHARTSGNPFLVVELVRELAPRLAAGPAELYRALSEVPGAVRQVVSGRVARLSARAREILALAAVAGPEFELARLQNAAATEPDDVLDALDEALGARLVEELPGAPGRLRFAHGLIHEAILAELDGLRRARLHLALGLAFEAAGGEVAAPAAELARHFLAAEALGTSARAAHWSLRAGAAASRSLAYEEAAGHYERALARLDPGALAPEARYDLLLALGRARHFGLGDYVRAREAFSAAAAVARELGDPARLAEAALAYAAIPQSSVPEAERECCAVLEDALAAQPPDAELARARLLARLAAFLASEPRRQAEAVALARGALATARRAQDASTVLEALLPLNRALRLQGLTPPEERLAVSAESSALAEALDAGVFENLARGQRISPLLELARRAEVDTEVDRYAALAERLRVPALSWLVPILRAMQQLLDGDFGRVEATALSALPVAAKVPGSVAPGVIAVLLYVLRREQGRLAEVEGAMRGLVASYPGVPGPRAWLALLLAESGRPDLAREELAWFAREGLGTLAGTEGWRPSLAMLGEACLAVGEDGLLPALHAELLPVARHCLVVGDGILCVGPAARVLGGMAARLGRLDEAWAHFERALALAGELRSPPWAARTRLDWARALLRHGGRADRARAAVLAGEARAAASAGGMPRIGAEAGEVLERLG
jgi:DNA-binding winged helix-turn-helix (wHTH) protein/tetratricopeptide (TPR) repeat protein